MKIWPFGKSEHRNADYGAALAAAFATLAGDASGGNAAQTAAAEFSIGLWGRSFASAEVKGASIPPQTLEAIGRNMALRGNALFDLRVDPVGGAVFLPASGWGNLWQRRSHGMDIRAHPSRTFQRFGCCA